MACILDQESIVVCGEIRQGGIQQVIAVYNFADWKLATVSQVDEDSPITDIVNSVGLKALKVESYDETGIIPECALREVEGNIDLLDHKVKMPVIQNTQPVRSSFLKARFTPVVVVAMRGDGTGIVYGKDGGMRLMEIEDLPQDPDKGSIMTVTVGTKSTQSGEPYLPTIIDAGDSVSTQEVFDALFVAGL